MAKDVAVKQDYAIMQGDPNDIKEIIAENLGEAAEISVMDLKRVSVPAGGSTTWTIPDIDHPSGEIEAKDITGIIVATKTTRQYWPDAYDGGSTPPQCASDDGMNGIGDPGGICADCPYNEFGSHPQGKRKACAEKKLIFMVRENDFLPTVVVAPAGSLKNVKSYLLELASKRRFVHSVYTTLSLEKDKNDEGIVFSKIVLKKVGDVDPKQQAATKDYAASIKPFLIRQAREMVQQGTV